MSTQKQIIRGQVFTAPYNGESLVWKVKHYFAKQVWVCETATRIQSYFEESQILEAIGQ